MGAARYNTPWPNVPREHILRPDLGRVNHGTTRSGTSRYFLACSWRLRKCGTSRIVSRIGNRFRRRFACVRSHSADRSLRIRPDVWWSLQSCGIDRALGRRAFSHVAGAALRRRAGRGCGPRRRRALSDRERKGWLRSAGRLRLERLRRALARQVRPPFRACLRGGDDIHVSDCHPGRDSRPGTGRLRGTHDRPVPYAHSPRQHPGDEHVREPGAQHRAGDFVGGWALQQLWLFWVAPIAGALLAGGLARAASRGKIRLPLIGDVDIPK